VPPGPIPDGPAAAGPGDVPGIGASPARRWRTPLVALAALRYLVPLAALPLVPVLVPDDIALLTLLRPAKEILLLGGGLSTTQATPTWIIALLAYLPLMVGGVWAFFGVGRAYAVELRDGAGPRWLERAIRPDQLVVAQRVLARRGPTIAILARLAALPPTIVAAAAGTTDVSARRFLTADLIGALAAFAITFGLGRALGSAYERGGPWLTGIGLGLLVAVVALLTRWLRREAGRAEA
jgi:membrane protein DedA with SNARE-associated domain